MSDNKELNYDEFLDVVSKCKQVRKTMKWQYLKIWSLLPSVNLFMILTLYMEYRVLNLFSNYHFDLLKKDFWKSLIQNSEINDILVVIWLAILLYLIFTKFYISKEFKCEDKNKIINTFKPHDYEYIINSLKSALNFSRNYRGRIIRMLKSYIISFIIPFSLAVLGAVLKNGISYDLLLVVFLIQQQR